jgi:biopolymer transport protein TolR
MAFNVKNDEASMSEINVTPLVDVMLVLLIIFIVTAPLLTQSIQVHLPETIKTNPASADPQTHIVYVELDLNGRLSFSKQQQPLQILHINESEKITQAFQTLLAQDKEIILAFSADNKAAHGEVMKIIARAQAVGISKLSFLTREEPPQ